MAKRILFFCGGYIVSGAEIITLNILSELKARGYEVFCISSGWGNGDFQTRLREAGIGYENVKLGFIYISKPIWTIDTLIHYPKAVVKVHQIIKNFKPDITYHINYRSILTIWFLFKKTKNYLHVHDPYIGKAAKIYLKILNKFVTKYIAVSEYICRNLKSSGADSNKIVIVKNGLKQIEVVYKSPKNIVSIGIIGQILSRKGHGFLIDAISMLSKSLTDFKVVIIGDGEEKYLSELKGRIRELNLEHFFIWTGYIKSQLEIYDLIDIVLVPSLSPDPFPTSALEAGIFFKPSIVTNMGGLPEIIIDGETGFIIKPNDVGNLSEKLYILITDKTKLMDMGISAHNHIKNTFPIREQINKLIQILEND